MADLIPIPSPNELATSELAQRIPVSRATYESLLPELRAFAFTVSGVTSADALQAIRDTVAQIPSGGDVGEAERAITDILAEHILLEDDLFNDAAAAKEHREKLARRAKFIVRNATFQAYARTAYAELDDLRDVFTHWQYITSQDERVRNTHRALDNIILPANHPFWLTHFPPWEFGCRCQIIGKLAAQVDEERAKDADRPVEERRVIEGEDLRRLEEERILIRNIGGAAMRIDVSSPLERGDTSAWRFDPRDLSLSFADLKGRYDAVTWAKFEAHMRSAPMIDGSGSVWEWLERGRIKAEATAPPAPVSLSGWEPAGTPVGPALEPEPVVKQSERKRINATLAAIESVHGDGPLPTIPVGHSAGGSLGVFTRIRTRDGKLTPHRIDYRIRSVPGKELHKELTLSHEIGHFIDSAGMPKAAGLKMATDDLTAPLVKPWWEAVTKSQAWQDLTSAAFYELQEYHQRPVEAWARSYAQFIAEESGSPVMQKQVENIRAEDHPHRQWDRTDFAPIKSAIRGIFEALGWMKRKQN